jgi:hypothetical protein
MKTILDRLLPFLVMAGAAVFAHAVEPSNILKNPGFEEETEVNMTKMVGPLLERGVEVPSGEAAIMPAQVYVNPADGWGLASKEASFEYVTGKPGEGVHTGKHAIRIVSPKVRVSTGVGGSIEVVDGVGLDESSINVNAACPFSFYAKGQGSVIVNAYMYDRKKGNIYDYITSRQVTPAIIRIDDDGKWVKYDGTLKITNPNVANISLVLSVQGDMVIDDVVLTPSK